MEPTILKPHVLVRGRWLAAPPQTLIRGDHLQWHFPGLSGEPALVLRYLIRTNEYKAWLVADWLSPREEIITGVLGAEVARTLRDSLPDHGVAAVFNARATRSSRGAR